MFGTPTVLARVYEWVSFFNLDTSQSLHEECVTGSQFLSTWLILSGILLASMTQACLLLLKSFSVRHLSEKIVFPRAQSLLFKGLNIAYPLVAHHVMKMLHCEEGRKGLELVHGPVVTKVKRVGSQLVKTEVLMPCWEGEHLPVGVIAIAVLCLYIVGYPIGSYLRLRTIYDDLKCNKDRQITWGDFVRDYVPSR